jgi:hypothetical protein
VLKTRKASESLTVSHTKSDGETVLIELQPNSSNRMQVAIPSRDLNIIDTRKAKSTKFVLFSGVFWLSLGLLQRLHRSAKRGKI